MGTHPLTSNCGCGRPFPPLPKKANKVSGAIVGDTREFVLELVLGESAGN